MKNRIIICLFFEFEVKNKNEPIDIGIHIHTQLNLISNIILSRLFWNFVIY